MVKKDKSKEKDMEPGTWSSFIRFLTPSRPSSATSGTVEKSPRTSRAPTPSPLKPPSSPGFSYLSPSPTSPAPRSPGTPFLNGRTGTPSPVFLLSPPPDDENGYLSASPSSPGGYESPPSSPAPGGLSRVSWARSSARRTMERAKKRFANAIEGIRNLGGRNELSIDVEERLQPEHACLTRIVRHGLPDDARCIAYDPVQRLLAIGAGRGIVRMIGDAGVDYMLQHPTNDVVRHVAFVINEGALITACDNDTVHLWNFRQKHPEIVNTLQMQKEAVTCLHLPYGGRWLMVGTEKGNVYFVCVSTFQLSSYVINWNKAIDIACRVHPGHIREISTCPTDCSKIAIVFEKGVVAIWNLATREAERLPMDPPIKWMSWMWTGTSLITGNVDGSLCVYKDRKWNEPSQKWNPHGESAGPCRPINRVEWKHTADNEQCLIFLGGMPSADNLPVPAITMLKGKGNHTVMELEHHITSFLAMCPSPHEHIPNPPYAATILMKNSIMVIDMLQSHPKFIPADPYITDFNNVQFPEIAPEKLFPAFESPHIFDMHETPITCLAYYSDCPSDLMGALALVGSKQRKQGQSTRKWPLNGGIARDCASGHQELVLTGHKDGAIRFWAASGEDLQLLYRVKAAAHFERDDGDGAASEASHAIKSIELCLDSRLLLTTGVSGQATLFRFVKVESMNTIAVVNIPLLAPPATATTSTSGVLTAASSEDSTRAREIRRQRKVLSRDSYNTTHSSDTSDEGDERILPFKVRGAMVKRPAGYQPELSCLVPWRSATQPDPITATALNSAFGVLALGTGNGLALVDIAGCSLIYAWTSSELYGSDPTPAVALGQLSLGDGSPCEPSHPPLEHHGESEDLLEYGEEAAETPDAARPEAAGTRPERIPGADGLPEGRPPARSHSVKGHGIIRRLTNKGHSIARSFSLHVKENGGSSKEGSSKEQENNGDISPRLGAASISNNNNALNAHGCSPSTSTASLERAGKQISDVGQNPEGVSSLAFMHSYTKRDKAAQASLWVGTSSGALIALNLLLPADRLSNTVVVAPSGTVLRMRGSSLYTGWMDGSFCLLDAPTERFKEGASSSSPDRCTTNKVLTKESLSPVFTGTQEAPSAEELSQVLILVSEWEIKTVALPSLLSLFTYKCENMPFVKARTSHIRGSPCIIALTARGETAVLSLPTLRLLKSEQLFATKSMELDDPIAKEAAFSTTSSPSSSSSSSSMPSSCTSSSLPAPPPIRRFALSLDGRGGYRNPFDEPESTHLPSAPYRTPPEWYRYPVRPGPSGDGPTPLRTPLELPPPRGLWDALMGGCFGMCQRIATSEHGLGVYMASPSEIEKYTVCSEMAEQVADSMGELFVPMEVPEAKVPAAALVGEGGATGFLKGIFSGGNASPRAAIPADLDAILLDKPGTSSGVGMRSVAKTIPGPSLTRMDTAKGVALTAGQAAAQAIQNLNERGDKLNATVDATEQLKNSAANMASNSAKLAQKWEKKSRWGFF